jgi:hypothetical protein
VIPFTFNPFGPWPASPCKKNDPGVKQCGCAVCMPVQRPSTPQPSAVPRCAKCGEDYPYAEPKDGETFVCKSCRSYEEMGT